METNSCTLMGPNIRIHDRLAHSTTKSNLRTLSKDLVLTYTITTCVAIGDQGAFGPITVAPAAVVKHCV